MQFIKTVQRLQVATIFLLILSVVSGCKQDKASKLTVHNPLAFTVEASSSSYVLDDIPMGSDKSFILDDFYDEEVWFTSSYDNNDGTSTIINKFSFDVSPGNEYFWDVTTNEITITGTTGGNNSGNNSDLVGKWMSTTGCTNANGDRSYFRFGSNGKGIFFNADCNSTCDGYGITFNFSYAVRASTISLNYTTTDPYCGQPVNTPSPEDLSYTLTGSELTVNSVVYRKM